MSKPAIKVEGNFTMKIVEASIIVHRFRGEKDPNAMEVKLTCEDDTGSATIYLSISGDYIQKGANSGRQESEVAFEQLAHLGISEDGQNLGALDTLVGKTVSVFGKNNEKNRLNFYLSSQRPEVRIDKNEVAARLARLTGPRPDAPPAREVPPLPAGDDIPF